MRLKLENTSTLLSAIIALLCTRTSILAEICCLTASRSYQKLGANFFIFRKSCRVGKEFRRLNRLYAFLFSSRRTLLLMRVWAVFIHKESRKKVEVHHIVTMHGRLNLCKLIALKVLIVLLLFSIMAIAAS